MKKIRVRQYIEVVRIMDIQVADDEDIDDAVSVASSLPLGAESLPEGVQLVSDWSYVCDSDDYEDEDGNPAG